MSNHNRDHLSASPLSSVPSFVERIDLDAIAAVATAARSRSTSLSVACTVITIPKLGAFNVVWFIDFADGVQWVLRTPIAEWSPALEKRLRSDIFAMQYIQNRTSIPMPPIHDFCVTPENTVGRPYTLMERVKGTQLCKVWFDPVWFTEEHRKTVFRSLVSAMSQLRALEFSAIGSLDFDTNTGSHVVVPLIPSLADISNGNTTETGPYTTVHAYLLGEIARQTTSAPSLDHEISLSLLRMFAGALPDTSLDGPPFVLSMPDFNYQNIFVDDNGEVTGLIDWDGIFAGPRQGGYARYPSWITRDWDPLMYGYPTVDEPSCDGESEGDESESNKDESTFASKDGTTKKDGEIPSREELQEDSPSALQAFRAEYLAIFEQVDLASARYTRDSHVYEAVEIATFSPFCRGHILDKLTRYVFGKGENEKSGHTFSAWSLKEGIRVGDWVNG